MKLSHVWKYNNNHHYWWRKWEFRRSTNSIHPAVCGCKYVVHFDVNETPNWIELSSNTHTKKHSEMCWSLCVLFRCVLFAIVRISINWNHHFGITHFDFNGLLMSELGPKNCACACACLRMCLFKFLFIYFQWFIYFSPLEGSFYSF